MRVLFIGGTGLISTACTRLAIERGVELTLLRRGQRHADIPPKAKTLRADINDRAAVAKALEGQSFDVVVDWIGFIPADVERDIELFRGKTRQYIFISSASTYEKPSRNYLITEATPLANPFSDYARNKIVCEERLMRAYREEAFPVTIVRPSLTFGDPQVSLVMNSWQRPYTIIDRLLKGKKVIVPGDGSSLWVITHNSDFAKGFVGLMGNEEAIGEAFHITSEEVRTWDHYFHIVADALGVEAYIVHIPSDFIVACAPELQGTLIGDKSVSCVFDNSKIRRFVPDYRATTSYAEGIRRTLEWFDAEAGRKIVDGEFDAMCDKIIEGYEKGLTETVLSFSAGKG
jgi:nucleoside-diphosphate-sugar epimerase